MTRSPARAAGACALGIDIGAGSLKVSLVDSSARVLGSASCGYPTHAPHPGWSEQDPADWWRALCACVPRALAEAGRHPADVAAVALCAGAHTPVLVDAAGNTVRPAILWSDQRSVVEARSLAERHGDEILAITLNRPSPTWTLPQLQWLVTHEPSAARATRRVMIAKDWLRWKLTGEWHTDVTDAVGTLMWDHTAARWSERLCALIGWEPATLPPVVQPRAVVGTISARAAAECGLAAGTPVACGTSDTSAEAYGCGAAEPGAAVVKLATAATISIVGEEPRIHPGLINYPYAIPGLWYTITATNSCASSHRWLRDRFFMRPGDDGSTVFAEMDRLAGEVAPGSDGLLFHPYLVGERAPYWDPFLRADFVGITMQHDRGHFVRALYEGIAFSLRDVLGEFRRHAIGFSRVRIIGGGSRSALWRQIVADVLQLRVALPMTTDAAVGAALLAGVASGLFADERAAAACVQGETARHEPDPARAARYDALYQLYRETKSSLTAINHRLFAFQQGR